jgi:Tfp pilus assembly protein PilN
MLHTNLSTRPFYNERAVHAGLAVVAVAALMLTVYNAASIVALTGQQRELSARATVAESRARELRADGQRLRAALDRADVEAVRLASAEANQLIDRRAFSWTELFNQFEATLPGDVRITSVMPQVDNEGRMLLAVNVISRRVEDLDTFIRRLEGTGVFRAVLTRQEEVMADGMLRSVLQGYYGHTAAPALPASEPGVTAEPPPPDGFGAEGVPR